MSVCVKITAKEVSKLRKTTGAGMMDCKKALVEANGDFEAAIEYLRKKGQKVAAKRADRETSEGAAIAKISDDATKGIVIVLSCETDFVSKNAGFLSLANEIADVTLANYPENLDALLALDMNGTTVGTRITDETGKIGEKLQISSYERLESTAVVPYIHAGNKIGVLVGLNQTSDAAKELGKSVAMQIAAMSPIAVDENGVSEEIKAKELRIGREQAIAEGKPEKILDRIAEGKLKRFFKDSTLLNQKYVKDSSQTVRQALQSIDKGLTVTAFVRESIKK